MTQSLAHAVAMALAAELGGGIRKSGQGWTVRCLSHPDSSPSLVIADGRGGILFHCHGGCRQEDVLADLIGWGLLPDHRAQQRGRRQLVTKDQIRLARTALAIWDGDRKKRLPITKEDEAARKEARRVLALAKKSPPRTPIPWTICLVGDEVRIDVGEACRGLPAARQEPLVVHWPLEIEAALIIDQGAPEEVLERLARQCLRAGALVVRVVSGGRMDVYRRPVGEVGHV
jgi:hypothetical protein